MITATKTCRNCLRPLPLTEFHRHASTRDRLMPHCKRCRNAAKARGGEHPESQREREQNRLFNQTVRTIFGSLNEGALK